MTRRQLCNYYLVRTTKENDQGCLKVLPEVCDYHTNGYIYVSFKYKKQKSL